MGDINLVGRNYGWPDGRLILRLLGRKFIWEINNFRSIYAMRLGFFVSTVCLHRDSFSCFPSFEEPAFFSTAIHAFYAPIQFSKVSVISFMRMFR
jgi:hypothetical protein